MRGRTARENERKNSEGEQRGRTAAGWLLLTLLTDWRRFRGCWVIYPSVADAIWRWFQIACRSWKLHEGKRYPDGSDRRVIGICMGNNEVSDGV
jgi:hypothetical protein